VSATHGATVDELLKRRWRVMEITRLRSAEREIFIANYLEQYGKTLNQAVLKRLASADRAGDPRYLRIVLEEMRLFGRHDDLSDHIKYLLAAQNPDELLERLFVRLEEDYVSPHPYRPELVRNTLALIWAAREGLSESELATLLGTASEPLPGAVWSPFYLAVKELLLNRSGLLAFFNDDFRRVVEKRYLPGDAEKRVAHRELADHFMHSGSLQRRNLELPWHLAAVGAWSELAALLAAPEFLGAVWPTLQLDLRSFWARIEACSSVRMLDAFAPILAEPTEHRKCLIAVCTLLSDAGHVTEAFELSNHIERYSRESGDLANLRKCLSQRAKLFKQRGHFDEALILFREVEHLSRLEENQAAVAASLGNQGVILQGMGHHEAALTIHKLEESLCRSLQDIAGLGASLGNQGVILQALDDRAGALRLLREQEIICRQLGDIDGLQKSVGNQGMILWEEGKTARALKLVEEDERLCRQLGDRSSLHLCLGNQGLIFGSIGDYDRALDLYRQKEKICREIRDMSGLVDALCSQSNLFAHKLSQPLLAAPFARQAQEIARQNGLKQRAQEIEDFLLSLNVKN
jgi:tetratricopeptide (TPR) repeat protein